MNISYILQVEKFKFRDFIKLKKVQFLEHITELMKDLYVCVLKIFCQITSLYFCVVTRHKRTLHSGVKRRYIRINLPVLSVFRNEAYRVVTEASTADKSDGH